MNSLNRMISFIFLLCFSHLSIHCTFQKYSTNSSNSSDNTCRRNPCRKEGRIRLKLVCDEDKYLVINLSHIKVKFPSILGPFNDKWMCKLKCIDGNWVGPLCASSVDGRFQPMLKGCNFNNDYPFLMIAFNNVTINTSTVFPHASIIYVRCHIFGLYKLNGDNILKCNNGVWVPKFPSCVPTTKVTNFTGDAPPSITYDMISGSASIEPSGELFVFPGSTLILNCVVQRTATDPQWSWRNTLLQHQNEWSRSTSDTEDQFGLKLRKMGNLHSDQYTCKSPAGHTNTISIKVVNVICPMVNGSLAPMISMSEGNNLGHSIHYRCSLGFQLQGQSKITCKGDGHWSSSPPECVRTMCPVPQLVDPHLQILECNTYYGGRVYFQCSWGYVLVGAPGAECEHDGKWSHEMPYCVLVYCSKPMKPEHGKLSPVSSKHSKRYLVGDIIFYICDENFKIRGESTIVCLENGVWSHPPPFCIAKDNPRDVDHINIDNQTLFYYNEKLL